MDEPIPATDQPSDQTTHTDVAISTMSKSDLVEYLNQHAPSQDMEYSKMAKMVLVRIAEKVAAGE